MPQEVNPRETSRAAAFELWMNARNPMVTLVLWTWGPWCALAGAGG